MRAQLSGAELLNEQELQDDSFSFYHLERTAAGDRAPPGHGANKSSTCVFELQTDKVKAAARDGQTVRGASS